MSNTSLSRILLGLFLSLHLCLKPAFSMGKGNSTDEKEERGTAHAILAVEEGENSIAFYHSETGKLIQRLFLGFYPHEVAVSEDGRTAYVSNFGIRDYNYRQGHPGNCVSVIDLKNFSETRRLYTTTRTTTNAGKIFWGPHGMKFHPNGTDLYVNVECVGERYPTSNAPQDSHMLVFDTLTGNVRDFISRHFSPHGEGPHHSYPLLPGAHNFIFAPTNPQQPQGEQDIWYYAGPNGVACIDPNTGYVKKHYLTANDPNHANSKAFNGPVRGLALHPNGHHILAAARNELSLIPLDSEQDDLVKFGNLGVGQIFYAMVIPGTQIALAPAAREGHVLVIDINPNSPKQGPARVIQRIPTGVDPLQVAMSPSERNVVYVTNPNSAYISKLRYEPENTAEPFSIIGEIATGGGVNGIGFSRYTELPKEHYLTLGACLPLSGEFAPEGRELRVGYEFWKDAVNKAGGFVVDGVRYFIKLVFEDTKSTTDNKALEEFFGNFIAKHNDIKTMFGTYPSSANEPLAAVLQPHQTPLITATGRDPLLFERGYSRVYGIAPLKGSSDLIGAFQSVYKHASIKPRTAMIIACDEEASHQEAETLENYLRDNSISVLNPFEVDSLQSSSIIRLSHAHTYEESHALQRLRERMKNLAKAARDNCKYNPELLFVLGHRRESAEVINLLSVEGFSAPRLFLNAGLPHYHFLTRVTAPVENAMGSVTWYQGAVGFSEDRFVSSEDFWRMFFERYTELPSDLIAGAAASGVVFEEALKLDPHMDGGFKPEKFLAGLERLNFTSFYGPVSFNEQGVNTGDVFPTILQLEGDRTVSHPIWPESARGWVKPKFPQ